MNTDVDIEGKYDYFFNSREWEQQNPDIFAHLKPLSIYEDEEFVSVCNSNPEIS